MCTHMHADMRSSWSRLTSNPPPAKPRHVMAQPHHRRFQEAVAPTTHAHVAEAPRLSLTLRNDQPCRALGRVAYPGADILRTRCRAWWPLRQLQSRRSVAIQSSQKRLASLAAFAPLGTPHLTSMSGLQSRGARLRPRRPAWHSRTASTYVTCPLRTARP